VPKVRSAAPGRDKCHALGLRWTAADRAGFM